jgi:transposase
MDLIDEQWSLIREYIPKEQFRKSKRGRPWSDSRRVLNGILWILRVRGKWSELPEKYGSKSTVHDRFKLWEKTGVMKVVLRELAEHLEQTSSLDVRKCFIDGSFASMRKEANGPVRETGVMELQLWQSETAMIYLSPYAQKALSPEECGLAKPAQG